MWQLKDRYAKAFYIYAENLLNDATIENIKKLANFFDENKQALFLCSMEHRDNAIKCLEKLLTKFNIDKIFLKLANLLIRKHRIEMFGNVLSSIVEVYNNIKNIIDVTIESSDILKDEVKRELENKWSLLLLRPNGPSNNIKFHYIVNKDLGSGIKMYSQDYCYQDFVKLNMIKIEKTLKDLI